MVVERQIRETSFRTEDGQLANRTAEFLIGPQRMDAP